MKNTNISFFIFALMVMVSSVIVLGIVSEHQSIADTKGSKCKETAECMSSCVRIETDFGGLCWETKAHPDPGKVCESGACSDECQNDTSAICGITYMRSCDDSVDCSGAPEVGITAIAGCN